MLDEAVSFNITILVIRDGEGGVWVTLTFKREEVWNREGERQTDREEGGGGGKRGEVKGGREKEGGREGRREGGEG